MLPDLEIRVLFCYSPEAVNSYNDLQQLQEDNTELCSITQDIFKRNITTYKVRVTFVNTIEIDTLQMQDYTHFRCLTLSQIQDLAECTTRGSIHNNPLKFGSLPMNLLQLKNRNQATILVLQVLLCEHGAGSGSLFGASAQVGVTNSRENIICIGRAQHIKFTKTCYLEPTILAHEWGHLMGCRHPYNPTQGGGGMGFAHSKDSNSCHGHCIIDNKTNKIACGTIMSYADKAVWYYSNPNLFKYPAPYQNEPCGVVGISEAYKTVNANIQKLAGIF